MQSLLRKDHHLQLSHSPEPGELTPDQVKIQVLTAGICRTDIALAKGQLSAPENIILGHEFAGLVTDVGSAVHHLQAGDYVTANPLQHCGRCAPCQQGQTAACLQPVFLGWHRHGAFADYILLDQAYVYRVPGHLSMHCAAYTEPVAAAMSVLKAGITPGQQGIILGDNRIAELIQLVLKTRGFNDFQVVASTAFDGIAANSCDVVIETEFDDAKAQQTFDVLKPSGLLVMRSRHRGDIRLDSQILLKKELCIKATNYVDFDQAVAFVVEHEALLAPLLGERFSLNNYEQAFDSAVAQQARKCFFDIAL